MRTSQFNLNRRLHMMLTMAALLGGALFLGGQGSDTPIIISDGSLTIDATVPWETFRDADASTKAHPHAAKSVTKVVVTAGGRTQTFDYSGQKCTVAIRYDRTDLVVSTDDHGKALQVKTDYRSFRRGASSNLMAHVNPNAKISSVTVRRGAQTLFAATPSGGTRISISYQ
jgi:hypothetical protein